MFVGTGKFRNYYYVSQDIDQWNDDNVSHGILQVL
jgi:hypothetical protein